MSLADDVVCSINRQARYRVRPGPGDGMDDRIRRNVVAAIGSLVLALSVGLAHAQAPRSTALVVAEDAVPQTFDLT